MLRISEFTKVYTGDKRAVDGLSLRVDAGDIYGFIGHNGAGKTTTLKAVAGILDFEEGEILVDGKSIKEEAVACKRVMAYIPDNPEIYEYLTGVQYLNFIGDMYRVDGSVRKERILRYAQALELDRFLGDMISSYSHGMKQKLVLISALIHQPKLLILDEPFVGLDPRATVTLREFMKELCENGSAIFFSTHVLDVAAKLCNKVAIIKNGKLIVNGDTEKVMGESSLEDVFMEVYDHG